MWHSSTLESSWGRRGKRERMGRYTRHCSKQAPQSPWACLAAQSIQRSAFSPPSCWAFPSHRLRRSQSWGMRPGPLDCSLANLSHRPPCCCTPAMMIQRLAVFFAPGAEAAKTRQRRPLSRSPVEYASTLRFVPLANTPQTRISMIGLVGHASKFSAIVG
jgi:hypothetical protein